MDFDKILNESTEDETTEAFAKEVMKVLIDNASTFKGRVNKPVVVNVKYKNLASKLKEVSGLSITREKAKAIFNAVRKIMGL